MTEIVTLQRESARPCFLWLVPAWFLVGAVLGVLWPGQSYQLFAIGTLPGVWAAFVVGAENGMFAWLGPTLLAGLPIMLFLGLLLDRLRTDLRLWVIAALVGATIAGYVMLQSYNDLQVAMDDHGGLVPFGVCAWQLGSYGATLLLLAIGAGRGARR